MISNLLFVVLAELRLHSVEREYFQRQFRRLFEDL